MYCVPNPLFGMLNFFLSTYGNYTNYKVNIYRAF